MSRELEEGGVRKGREGKGWDGHGVVIARWGQANVGGWV